MQTVLTIAWVLVFTFILGTLWAISDAAGNRNVSRDSKHRDNNE